MKIERGTPYNDVNNYLTSKMFVRFTIPRVSDSRELWVIYTLGSTQIVLMCWDSLNNDMIVLEIYKRDRDTFRSVASVAL